MDHGKRVRVGLFSLNMLTEACDARRNSTMAIEWIKWIKGLANKREVLLISAELGIDRHEVAGRLMVLWEWCDENITEHEVDEKGNAMVTLGALPERTINSIVGVTGFAEAMANAQWLRLANTGATFPNFARHNGETAKSRALTAKRVARHKQKGNASANDEVTPPALPNALPRIEENRREEHTRERESEAAKQHVANWPMPQNASEPRHRIALAKWQEVRKRMHGHYLDEIAWQATVITHQSMSADAWHAALMRSVQHSAKSLCVQDFNAKSKPANAPKEVVYPELTAPTREPTR